jgi:hypothetical protein
MNCCFVPKQARQVFKPEVGYAAVSVIGDAQGMGFERRLTESTRRSSG